MIIKTHKIAAEVTRSKVKELQDGYQIKMVISLKACKYKNYRSQPF